MKFLRRILIFTLIIFGVIGVIWEIWGNKGFEGFRGFERRVTVEPTKPPKGKTLKFVVMGDIHSNWENFRRALGKAKTDMGVEPSFAEASADAKAMADKSDGKGFVVIVGDLTTIGKKSELLEAKKILDGSGLVYYMIPGNHDLWWERQYKRDVWREVFGESFQSFKIEETKFILINNGDGVGGINKFKVLTADGGIPSKGGKSSKFKIGGEEGQMEWLERETEECLWMTCLVFLHIPLNHPNSLHVMGEDNPKVASEAGELIKLFVDNKVKEVFAGHLHFSSSYELDGLRTTIVGAVTSERNFQSPKFLEINLHDGAMEKKEVFLSP